MFPNLGEICRLILDYKPDVIVIRELSTTGMIVFAIGHLVTRRFVRYIQHPAFCVSSPGRAKRTFAKRFFDSLFRCTITPVMGTGAVPRIPGIRFVPFTVPGTAAPLERKYVAGGTVRFFSIGKFFATRKGHAILIRALDNLAEEFDFRLTLFGGVRSEEDSNYQEIIELVKSSRIASRTTVRTNVPNDECRLEYLSQDVFVLPSSGEPAAYSPFEAISFGLPVVCTTENGTRYVIEEGKNGFLVPPNDVDALAKALRAFLADPSLIESMGKQSSRISSDKYSSRAVYPKLIEALNA